MRDSLLLLTSHYRVPCLISILPSVPFNSQSGDPLQGRGRGTKTKNKQIEKKKKKPLKGKVRKQRKEFTVGMDGERLACRV